MDTFVPHQARDHALEDDAWHDAWAAALNQVELEADRVEQILTAVHRGSELPDALDVLQRRFEPPTGIGPVPDAFVDRARALLLRHTRLSEDLEQTVGMLRRHEQAIDAVAARPPSVPAFVDVAL